jgi:hypothetical protein
MHKLAHAYKKGTGVSLRLHRGHITPNGIPLVISDTAYRNLMTSPSAHTVHVSADHVKSGGFLGALIGALPTIASVIGGISGLTGIASNIKTMVTGNGVGNGLYLNHEHGLITDHIPNIPIITPALKFLGLGTKRRRRTHK